MRCADMAAAVTAVLALGFLGLLGWYVTQDIPGVVWGITLFFGLIVGLFAASVWADKFELRIEAKDVVVTKPRPWGTSVTRVPRAEVQSVKREKAMSSGENQYFCLSLVGVTGVEPGSAVQDGEPFAVRKLRHQYETLLKAGQMTAEQRGEFEIKIMAELKRQPKFSVPFARHIPGQARAEAIGALVMGAIRGK